MSESVVHVEGGAKREAERAPRLRTRTCVGCGVRVTDGSAEAADLVRLTLGSEGSIVVDVRGGAPGRGAHVHARPACLDRAARGGLARSTKGRAARVDARALGRTIQEAMDRRIEALFERGARDKQLARGPEAVAEACERQEAELLVIARDAAEAAELPLVRRAIDEGRAVAWGDAERLGHVEVVAVMASSSGPIARAMAAAVRMSDACAEAAIAATSAPNGRGKGRGKGARNAGAARTASAEQGLTPRRLSRVGSNLERGA